MAARIVLVVDPAPLTAARVEQALVGTGFRLVLAKDGGDAERLIEANDFAAVLAAVTFPKGNGYDLSRQVKARHPDAVVFLLCGGFEVFNADRAAEAGVTGRISKPFTVDVLRRHLEGAFGPLGLETPAEMPEDADRAVTYEGVLTPEIDGVPGNRAPSPGPTPAGVPIAPSAPPGAAPLTSIGDERIATFLPRDFRVHPPVSVDPEVVGPAMERAILEVLPEVVEALLAKALATSPAFRDMVEVAVDEAVRAQLQGIARRVVRERLAEIEAQGEGEG